MDDSNREMIKLSSTIKKEDTKKLEKIQLLLKNANRVLESNWNNKYNITIPSQKLYPYQWSWDSGFIAIGNSYINIEKAIKEIENLFSAQWKSGMVPHVIFYEKSDTYWPEPNYYEIHRSPHSLSNHILTSGLTQPPIHAISCYYIYQNAKAFDKNNNKNNNNKNNNKNKSSNSKEKKALSFLRKMFPKLMQFHRYLMKYRDPENSGLVTIFHPWESGMDDSPLWDETFERILKERQNKILSVKFERKDIKAIENRDYERPSENIYRMFIYLIDQMKKYNYDELEMHENFPFKIKDIVFNSIFYVANKYLLKIATIEDNILNGDNNNEYNNLKDSKREIKNWLKIQERGFKKYFETTIYETIDNNNNNIINQIPLSIYFNFDVNKNDFTKKFTCSSFIPLFTGIPSKKQAIDLINIMKLKKFCDGGFTNYQNNIKSKESTVTNTIDNNISNTNYKNQNPNAIPSYSLYENDFDPNRYWRGPCWVNINWMIYYGLLNYDYIDHANNIKNAVISLIEEAGYREYYNPFTSNGLGGKNFSWTAALVIDLLLNSPYTNNNNNNNKYNGQNNNKKIKMAFS